LPDVLEEGPDYCDTDAFFKAGGNGGECSPIEPNKPCFMECEAGGCFCVMGPKGTGIWQCTVDTSCLPKCMPEDPDCGLEGGVFADTGPIPEASIDATSDGAADGGAKESGADAPSDARKDSSGG
jgi:hypothetical protein